MKNNKATFVDVILPLSLPQLYTYAVSFEMAEDINVGHRVIVQFGRKKMYTAIVAKVHNTQPQGVKPKLIESIADDEVLVTEKQLKLWHWIADYYMSSLGEVMAAALPSAFKLSSETIFLFNNIPDIPWEKLSDEEHVLVEALQANNELSLGDVQTILGKKTVFPIIDNLMHHRLCVVKEALQSKYQPKLIKYIRLHKRYNNENELRELFNRLEKKPKQLEVLMKFLQVANKRKKLLKSELTTLEISASSLKTLIKNDVFVETEESVSRLISKEIDVQHLEKLNAEQKNVFEEIKQIFEEKNVAVLDGVTGSGKTHVYVKLIEEQLKIGKQILYLLPEIALTAQIVMRLQKYFGSQVGVYHSKFSDVERVEIYHKVKNNEYSIVLAARSGVFLPFNNLGLIIVDEEHESSYKQYDPAPRYNARDIAVILTSIYNCKTLLGSATISLETNRNVALGKFGKSVLSQRFGNAVLPSIELLNTIDLKQRKKMSGLFSEPLKQAIRDSLEKKEQVIIFQNRRGFANYLNCQTCNWIPYCPNCDVTLTYHKYFNKLMCHYCGHQEKTHENCKACGSKDLTVKGVGTEQIEDEINILFPENTTARLDLDTTRRKHGHEEIIFAFQQKEVDILIGTQMVTKGLDFDNVSLVGIVNADQLINFPDFKAAEKAFQLITQVSGRAGRKDKKGTVVIQTGNPNHPILQYVKNYNYKDFQFEELINRKQYHYPPFYNLIQLTIKHKQAEVVRDASKFLADLLRKKIGSRVLGPTTPMVSRVKNQYLKQLLLKLEKDKIFIKETKNHIFLALEKTKTSFKTIRINIDVDP